MRPKGWMETTFNGASKYNVSDHDSGDGGGGGGGDLRPPFYEAHRNSSVYDTSYLKSLRHYLTREVLPKESHYRDLDELVGTAVRPTLEDLHDNTYRGEGKGEPTEEVPAEEVKGIVKLGWIKGVYISCLLNIWSVMLFLRVPWIIGEAGIVLGLIIMSLANLVTFITTLSMSAVATNGQIKGDKQYGFCSGRSSGDLLSYVLHGWNEARDRQCETHALALNISKGGIYYMISRTLGPEFGAAIGLMFTVAISIATAVHSIGFINAVQGMLEDYAGIYEIIPGTGGGKNDVRILSVITVLLMLIPAIVGMEWVIRVQIFLLVVLVAAQVDFVVGALIGPVDDLSAAKGFIGPNGYVFIENLKPDFAYRDEEQSFFSVFAVFFPAVTGIVAGANISGDLKAPSSAIPKGTLFAVGTTYVAYIIYGFVIGLTCTRHAYGNETVYLEYQNYSSNNPYENPAFTTLCPFDKNGQSECLFGSENDFKIMVVTAGWGPLIYIGCFAASLSSVIACLVGSPRILQALAKDKLYPLIHVFAKGYGVNDNPMRGYVMVCLMTFCCLMMGDLNSVSTLLTNFYLASYALVNFSCFHASLVKSPGWRPSFKFYNCWVSLIGSILCIVVMFLIDWITAFCTLAVCVFLYFYVSHRKADVNWGSSVQAQSYSKALKSSLELVSVDDHVKNFRPQILLLSGTPGARPALIDFSYSLTKNISLLTCANIVKGPLTQKLLTNMNSQAYSWMNKHHIKGFYAGVEANTLEEGSKYLFQLCGLGKLRPNIVLLGYKTNWQKCDRIQMKAYFNTLHKALDMNYGLVILRLPEGFDYSNVLNQEDFHYSMQANEISTSAVPVTANGDTLSQSQDPQDEFSYSNFPNTNITDEKIKKNDPSNYYKGLCGSELSRDVLNKITRFRVKQKKGTIDVWWLYNDGGLTVLLPFILSNRSQWSGCKLRVFALANREDEMELEQRSMINLLNKFRIDFSDVVILHDIVSKADSSQREKFEKLINEFRATSDTISKEDEGILITETEFLSHREKTNRQIRLRELLLENSKEASLVVMTLPMPRKNSVSAPLYMAWLETLTRGMPPFMLIRGNQQSVLTYYS